MCLGTWVSPQLLVILSKIDTEFKTKSSKLLEKNGFELICQDVLTEQEFRERKFNYEITKNKIKNATSYLLNREYDQTVDDDGGGSIAENWNTQLIEMKKLDLI